MATTRSRWVLLLVFGLVLLTAISESASALSSTFYQLSCPNVTDIVRRKVTQFISANKNLAGGFLRLHFHDCWVQGCDASILLSSTATNQAEIAAHANFKLRGIAEIVSIKSSLEARCPGIVSCADIVALAARDATVLVGGPSWSVPLGRRDGISSSAVRANRFLPVPNLSFAGLVANFAAKGFTTREMIVLSGAHTIGIAHCNAVQPHLYNFTGVENRSDPSLDPTFVASLKIFCPKGNRTNLVHMDGSINVFDGAYFNKVINNRGLFTTDAALITSAAGRRIVQSFTLPNSTFFKEFAAAMQKMGTLGASSLTGTQGQIRKHCQVVNSA